MTLDTLNTLPKSEALEQFAICCGASKWVEEITAFRPFQHKNELFDLTEKIWFSLNSEDWLEAFSRCAKNFKKQNHGLKRNSQESKRLAKIS